MALVDDIPRAQIQRRSDVEDVSQVKTQARHHSLAKRDNSSLQPCGELQSQTGKVPVKYRHLQEL